MKMGYTKQFTTSYGISANYSEVVKTTLDLENKVARIDFKVWASKEAYEQGSLPLADTNLFIRNEEFDTFYKTLNLRKAILSKAVSGVYSGAIVDGEDTFMAELSVEEEDFTSSSEVLVTLVFSQIIDDTTLSLSDFTVTNGSLSDLDSDDSITYTFVWSIDEGQTSTVQLNADTVQSSDGENNSVSNVLSLTHDIIVPVLSMSETSPTSLTEIPVILTFDRAVKRIHPHDFDVTNGSVTDLTTDDDVVYTLTWIINENSTSLLQLLADVTEDENYKDVKNYASNILTITHSA